MRKNSVRKLTISALLIGMGVIIPMVMPKIMIPPASFTLASHVPLFIAMFFTPGVAVAVALGTTFGFFLTTPVIIALRALSHLVFALIGAWYLQKHPSIVLKNGQFTFANWRFQGFNFVIGVIHSLAEMLVVSIFYFIGNMPETYYSQGYFYTVFILMGIGGLIHSLVDYNIAYFIAGTLSKYFDIPVFTAAKKSERVDSRVREENDILDMISQKKNSHLVMDNKSSKMRVFCPKKSCTNIFWHSSNRGQFMEV
jgi:niacin transporter